MNNDIGVQISTSNAIFVQVRLYGGIIFVLFCYVQGGQLNMAVYRKRTMDKLFI